MNVLLIIVISIIALCAIYGYWKGFIRMLFSVISLAATIVLVMAVTPYISDFLINKTSTYNNLKVK
ncbi:CvpA family protein, partial [bacterium 1XD42-8]